jgi:hypothetical protein
MTLCDGCEFKQWVAVKQNDILYPSCVYSLVCLVCLVCIPACLLIPALRHVFCHLLWQLEQTELRIQCNGITDSDFWLAEVAERDAKSCVSPLLLLASLCCIKNSCVKFAVLIRAGLHGSSVPCASVRAVMLRRCCLSHA